MIRENVIKFLMENNILINPDIIETIPNDERFDISFFYEKVLANKENMSDELLSDIITEVKDKMMSIMDSKKAFDYDDRIDDVLKKFDIKLVQNYVKDPEKKEMKDFISHYNKRLDTIGSMLKNRQELEGVVSISRLKQNEDRAPNDKAALIGMVLEKNETKNGHYMLTMEDRSGTIKVLVNKNNQELMDICDDLMLDEVIGIVGSLGDDIMFSDSIIYPDVPLHKPLKKCPKDDYAIFISDTHIGSKMFKGDEFLRFIDWLNCNVGNEAQKSIAKKVKYLFIVGDLVEGVGIFPSQEHDVEIKDVYEQYDKAFEYLNKIRKDICIVITPGNHDPMRIAEPQPMHYKDYAKKLYEMENVVFVTSPSLLTINQSDTFEGIDVMLYHGFSIPFYADRVPSIRKAGGMKRTDLIMEYYLKRRHLAPTHTSTQFIADSEYDPLVITKIPDILATGHIHTYTVSNYRNVTCLNCSCWLSSTDYQVKQGMIPQPCRALLVNLHTRKVNVLKFGEDEAEKTASE